MGPQVRTSGGSKERVESGTLEGYFGRDSWRVCRTRLPEGTLTGTLEGYVYRTGQGAIGGMLNANCYNVTPILFCLSSINVNAITVKAK